MSGKHIRVLFVDDEIQNLAGFKAIFRKEFSVITAQSAEEARQVLRNEDIHIIITDQRMPVERGTKLLKSIRKSHPDVMKLILTGTQDIRDVIEAVNIGKVFRILTKPTNDQLLRDTILNAYRVYEKRVEKKMLEKKLILTNQQLEFQLRQMLID